MRSFFLSIFLVIIGPISALAWGQEGHSIVAEIAQRRLSPQAATMVSTLLGPGVSLGSIASWADDARDARPTTYNWHFVSIPIGRATYDPTIDCKPDAAKGDCVVAEVERARKEMNCATDQAARAEALKFLVHFVGDLHQPFHTVLEEIGMNNHSVTTRIGGETCGKSCAFYQLKSTDENLHTVWDSSLIKKEVYGWGAYVDRLESGWLETANVVTVQAGDPASWAVETHVVAMKVYADTPTDNFLDDAYFDKEIGVVDQQLGRAGLRLAKLLSDPVSCQ
ncbi:MAG: S1/P1 nuclease [Shinella sp.]|uniref:S1/P1 nuclease n=2 Tax=Shinella sp. TaxID=1870904 RepID=UPI0040371062